MDRTEILLFSLLVVKLEASSGLTLVVFSGLTTEEEESFFFVITPSAVFFFTFTPSLLTFTLSVLPLALTFEPFSFFDLSDPALEVDLVVGLESMAVLLDAEALEGAAPAGGLDEIGGVLVCEDISSIGSSLTGVASPLSSE